MRSDKVKIEIMGVTVLYGSIKALNKVTLRIREGEFTGIIGPNGSGKTTLLRCIYRAVKPIHGAIYLSGRNLMDYGHRELAKNIAVIPTEIPAEFNLSVADIVLMGRYPYNNNISWWESNDDINKVNKIITRLNLESVMNRSFSTLSSGQKRRVLIAKALAQEPKILLADEPTSNLDLRYQFEVVELLREIALSGVTVISTFHDLNIAARICDKLILLKDGKVFSVGKPSEVLTPSSIQEVYGVEVEVIKAHDGIFIMPKGLLR